MMLYGNACKNAAHAHDAARAHRINSQRADMFDDQVSAHVKRCLSLLKDRIGRHQSRWDACKIACNPYEMVYLAPPCVMGCDGEKRHPISRAFYKLVEMVTDDPDLNAVVSDPSPKRFAYIAEAPGSFVEAVVTMRMRNNVQRGGGRTESRGDSHHGITLSSDRRSVPHWKLQGGWMRAFNVSLCRGADGSGDVTVLANVDSFVLECGGEAACDMVTADGGFDFSSNFNEQESQMGRLLAAEVLAATRLIRPGGCAVVKVFDAFNSETVDLMAAFIDRFERAAVVKPKTSRPANSERYMVCSGYRGKCASLCIALEAYITDGTPLTAATHSIRPSPAAVSLVVDSNLLHCVAQMECIVLTLDVLESGAVAPTRDMSAEWIERYLAFTDTPVTELSAARKLA